MFSPWFEYLALGQGARAKKKMKAFRKALWGHTSKGFPGCQIDPFGTQKSLLREALIPFRSYFFLVPLFKGRLIGLDESQRIFERPEPACAIIAIVNERVFRIRIRCAFDRICAVRNFFEQPGYKGHGWIRVQAHRPTASYRDRHSFLKKVPEEARRQYVAGRAQFPQLIIH